MQILPLLLNNNDLIQAGLHARGIAQEDLFAQARAARNQGFPEDRVEIRSVIEVSNICKQRCNYCSIGHPATKKYVIATQDLIQIAAFLYHERKRRVLLLQSGEHKNAHFIAKITRACAQIKDQMPDLILIVCMGNLAREQYRDLQAAGVERYLLKIETSNPVLYETVKPNDRWQERLRCLNDLIELGFRVGSGIIVGLPGQTEEDLIADLKFLTNLHLDMLSASVFIPGSETYYANMACGDVEMALNFMALLRIYNPHALIPTTSSLAKLKADGQYLGLMAGANTITIHDGTPPELQHLFSIYDQKRFCPTDDHLRKIVERADLKFVDHVPLLV